MCWTMPGTDEVAEMAKSLGFNYFSRPRQGLPRADAKSGNLNFGLSRSQGEIILVLDADQVPQSDIISRMVGFFSLPRVAYVQSRQEFLLPDDDPFYNRDEVFYETIQLSNDQANAVISCGSGVLYRRQALMEIGGFATWNLVEDVTTSYELVSRGWKGIYFPYALSRGLAPDTLAGVVQQRYQWCLDTMRLFFWDNPFFKPGLTFSQRLHFSIIMIAYAISGLIMPIFYFLPLYCYLTGNSFLVEQERNYLTFRGIYLFCTILAFRYLFFQKDSLKQLKMLCGLFPVYALGTLAALWYPPGTQAPLSGQQSPGLSTGQNLGIYPASTCHHRLASVPALSIIIPGVGLAPAHCCQRPLLGLYHLGPGRDDLPGLEQTTLDYQAASPAYL